MEKLIKDNLLYTVYMSVIDFNGCIKTRAFIDLVQIPRSRYGEVVKKLTELANIRNSKNGSYVFKYDLVENENAYMTTDQLIDKIQDRIGNEK